VALLAAALLAGVTTGPAADDDRPAWAYVENQRSEIVILKYSLVTDTASSTTIQELYPGRVLKLDTNTLDGEVCAGIEDDPNPAKILGCKTLVEGQRWVIY
jgi:hypothetical protein